jgi:hypothetical protein
MEEELKQEIIQLIKDSEEKDSMEIGNSKTGVVKIYCNFAKPIEATNKLLNAIAILKANRSGVFEQ